MCRMARRWPAIPRTLLSNDFFFLRDHFFCFEHEQRIAGKISQYRHGDSYQDGDICPQARVHAYGRADAVDEERDDTDVYQCRGRRNSEEFHILVVSCSLTFKHKEFVPKERMGDDDGERYGGKDSDLDAPRDAGDPQEEIEYRKTQERIEYTHKSVAHELPAQDLSREGLHVVEILPRSLQM